MKWWELCQDFVIEYCYKKKEVIAICVKMSNSYDLFFCILNIDKLIFSSGCRSPPHSNFKIWNLNGGKKMKFIIDSYELEYIEDENKYYISFKDSVNNECKMEIEKEIFDTYLISNKKRVSQRNENQRHIEPSNLTDVEIYHKAFNKPDSLEDEVMRRLDIEELNEAKKTLTETQLKRIELNIYKGISIRKLANIEGVRKSTIEKSIYKGFEKIKNFFKNRGGQKPF